MAFSMYGVKIHSPSAAMDADRMMLTLPSVSTNHSGAQARADR